jgi:hypothetical protein
MLSKIKHFYRKYGEITSFSIGIFGLVFGLIQYFYPYSSKADLKYFLKESIDVISIKENIEALKVYFNDRDIRKDSLNLKIFKIRLKNDGRSPVSQSDYASVPFGLYLQNGTVISVRHESSNEYLKNNIAPVIKDSVQIILGKCIIEYNDYVDFEILIVHKSYHTPTFKPLGKVAGIGSIALEAGSGDTTTLLDFIQGIFGLCVVLFFLFLPFYVIGKIIEVTQRFFRRKSILNFYDYPLSPLNDSQRAIVNVISEIGYKSTKPILKEMLDKKGHCDELYERELANKLIVEKFRRLVKDNSYSAEDLTVKKLEDYDSDNLFILDELKENNLLSNDSNRVKDEFLNEASILISKWP